MEPLSQITGPAAVLRRSDVDTDVIIRIEHLTGGDQSKLGEHAFEAIRYSPDGSDNPEFPLNQAGWRGAPILIAGANFGCGSSREGAVTALAQMGLRCVVAESFGDIFFANCFQNGLLPVRLPAGAVAQLMAASDARRASFTVDLEGQTIAAPDGSIHRFEVDPIRRENLLAGLDDLGLTLRDDALIEEWQAADRRTRPWIWSPVTRATREVAS